MVRGGQQRSGECSAVSWRGAGGRGNRGVVRSLSAGMKDTLDAIPDKSRIMVVALWQMEMKTVAFTAPHPHKPTRWWLVEAQRGLTATDARFSFGVYS